MTRNPGSLMLDLLKMAAWTVTGLVGIFLLLGVIAALKHVRQDYSIIYYVLVFFIAALLSSLKLSRLSAAKKTWPPVSTVSPNASTSR